MSNFYDEVCEYSYSTPVTENFSNDVNVQEKDQCVIKQTVQNNVNQNA